MWGFIEQHHITSLRGEGICRVTTVFYALGYSSLEALSCVHDAVICKPLSLLREDSLVPRPRPVFNFAFARRESLGTRLYDCATKAASEVL